MPNPSIPQCPSAEYPCNPTAKYPYTAQPQSIPAVPNCKVSSQCPTAKYPCSAQLQSIPAVPNCRVSLQPPNIPAVPNRRVSLQCPTAEYPWSAQQQSQYSRSAFEVLQGRQLRGGGAGKTLHFLCNNRFRVGMLEVNNPIAEHMYTHHTATNYYYISCNAVPSPHMTPRRMSPCTSPNPKP